MPEKRLLWHPRQENKFVVGGGSDITLYEWAPAQSEIKHITSQHGLQFMKCFAWSPDPSFDDLMAIGLTTGRVDLLRLEATKQARNSVLSSGPTVSLPVRNSRSCNALAFCEADPNYLAVGLDKVRGDSSLIIWDVHSASPILSMPPQSMPSHDEDLVLSSARPHPRIPRADIGPRTDMRILQQHAPTEIVSALSFLPNSTNLLLAGISHRWLRLFDLRSPVPFTTNVASKVHGIATDPFDPHRIACFGDGIVTVWDARRLPHPLLTFTEKDSYADGARRRANSIYTTVEFSSARRGTLAVLEKDSMYVRFWDMQQAQIAERSPSSERSRDSSRSGRVAGRRSWTNLPWTTTAPSGRDTTPAEPQEPSSILVLADTRRTKDFNRTLASFALVPSAKTHPLTANVMVVNDSGDLELYAIHDTPKQAPWSARGDIAIGAGQSYKIIAGFSDTEPPPEPWDLPTAQGRYPAPRTESLARSDRTREDSAVRGRSKHFSPTASFGRSGGGDEEAFAVLGGGTNGGVTAPTNLAATRPGKSRTFSPASFRHYQFEHSVERSSARAEGDAPPSRAGTVDQLARGITEDPRARSRRSLREKSASRVKKNTRGIQQLVEDDVSMTMRDRVIRGYGLSNPSHNVLVTQEDSDDMSLSELWAWIKHSKGLLLVPTPRLHGYDFSYQGLIGIWEGFQPSSQELSTPAPTPRSGLSELPPSTPGSIAAALGGYSKRRALSPSDEIHGDYHAAILVLCSRKGIERPAWKPLVSTQKTEQRQFALHLCGWSLKDEDLHGAIKKWEKEGKHSRAACWLVFTRHYSKAVELLMRSKDEAHNMMSGTLAALVPTEGPGPSRNPDLRAQCERLIVRLQDPYFRAMLTHLALGDWSEVLEEESLPLRERLAIAFQFLDDVALSSYLRRITERSIFRGDIEGIIVTGLTPPGMDILQSYVDRTGDIQTAAILSAYVSPAKFPDTRVGRWLEAYRDLLDGFKLFHHRVSFDIDRGQIIQDAVQNGDVAPFEWAPRQILIRCNYCNKAISVPGSSAAGQTTRATACPHCNRALPRCSICLMTLSIVRDDERNYELMRSRFKDTIDDAIVLCQTCRHGGHASHVLEWFFGQDGKQTHGTCAVADCDCRCADEF